MPTRLAPNPFLFTGLSMESLDAVVLCTAIQEHYRITMPFAELAEFVGQHVGAGAQAQPHEVEAGSQRLA
jgi:hypothetical protein